MTQAAERGAHLLHRQPAVAGCRGRRTRRSGGWSESSGTRHVQWVMERCETGAASGSGMSPSSTPRSLSQRLRSSHPNGYHMTFGRVEYVNGQGSLADPADGTPSREVRRLKALHSVSRGVFCTLPIASDRVSVSDGKGNVDFPSRARRLLRGTAGPARWAPIGTTTQTKDAIAGLLRSVRSTASFVGTRLSSPSPMRGQSPGHAPRKRRDQDRNSAYSPVTKARDGEDLDDES